MNRGFPWDKVILPTKTFMHSYVKSIGFLTENEIKPICGYLDVDAITPVLEKISELGKTFIRDKKYEETYNILNALRYANEVLNTCGEYETYVLEIACKTKCRDFPQFAEEVQKKADTQFISLLDCFLNNESVPLVEKKKMQKKLEESHSSLTICVDQEN
jgi:hypothetical protein